MSATKNSHDWHCEEHGTYGWRGESCRQCPEAPSKIKSLRAQIAEFKAENEQLRMALADTEALEIGTAERCAKLTHQRDEYKADADRYRWLENNKFVFNGNCLTLHGPILWEDTLTAAVDAQMKGATE